MQRKLVWVSWALIVLMCGATAAVYSWLPERIPIHWNLEGRVDGYGDRVWAVWLTPGIAVLVNLLFLGLPYLSPKGYRMEESRPILDFVSLLLTLFCVTLQMLTIYAVFEPGVDVGRWIVASILLMLAGLGNVLGKIQRNWFVGIRTPWTLASERVWADTHRLGAWLFTAAGIVGTVCVVAGLPLSVPFVLIVLAALSPVVYSLIHYKRLESRGLL